MNKYCCGCGVLLQCEEPYEDGYVYPTHFEETVMCRRCFRLKHYGEYKVTNKSNAFYKTIIKLLENKKPPKKSAVSILRRGRL